MKILDKLFSITDANDDRHTILTLFGIKFKYKHKRNKGYIPYLETHLCDHCNLNCKGCGRCAPLVEGEKFTDIEQFKKDINELSKKMIIPTIRLMGGEPLLHPNINQFIVAARKAFPKSLVKIVTNGILLPSMSEDFWQTLRENDIVVDLSKYPPCAEKFESYLDLIRSKNVKIGNVNDASKFFNQANPKGNSPIKKTFEHCSSKICVNLWNSLLYTCPVCYSYYFKKYFNTNEGPIVPGFDIYKMSGKELEKVLNKPIDACRFCNTTNMKYFDWEQSKKEKVECE